MTHIMPGAEPFSFDGNHIGCILTHGFTGTPNEVRELGQRLADAGYSVRGPLLPGHGTTPQDMEQSTWRDWYGAVEAAYDDLSTRCDQVLAMGLSMGGMLSLYLAANRPLSGVIPMATPILSPDWRLYVVGLLGRFIRFSKKRGNGSIWFDAAAEAKHIAYDVNPSKAAIEFKKLLKELDRALPRVTVPTLLINSRNDLTVRPENAKRIYEGISSVDKRLVWLEKSCHIITEDLEREVVFARVLDFVARLTREPEGVRVIRVPASTITPF